MQGRLIVFEGTDGSGKATQSALLCRELERRGIPFRKLEFPRYQEASSALIRLYLNGAFGSDPNDVNYSVDRYASYKQDWGGFYESGGLLVADRYTTSNAVHQTAKLPPEERDTFLDWLFDFEYRLLGLPEPTRVLYLDMPTEATEQMMRRREAATHTKADIHEQDEAYLRRCRENAHLQPLLTVEQPIQFVEVNEGDATAGKMQVVAQVQEYVKNHLSEKLTLADVAAVFNFSPNYLSQLFGKYGDSGFVEYITETRIAAAKEMLEQGDLKVYEIAEKLGYESAFYFSKVFKKVTGLSPREYQQSI